MKETTATITMAESNSDTTVSADLYKDSAPNKERLALWADALDSGRYQQVEGYLRKGDSYCCLGVACEVAIENGLEVNVAPVTDIDGAMQKDKDMVIYCYNDNSEHLPDAVADWYGISANPELQFLNEDYLPEEQRELDDNGEPNWEDYQEDPFQYIPATEANDDYRKSFPQIASAIREKYTLERGKVA